MATRRMGFIGLGMMGMPMALAAAKSGLEVIAHDAVPGRAEHFASQAGPDNSDIAASPAELGMECDVAILMLPTSAHVAAVAPELAASMCKGGLIIDMGSSIPGETRKLAEKLSPRTTLIDAPVSGSVARAKTGTLSIMVGGSPESFARAEPYLRAMGTTLIHTGETGSAHAMKALNNYVYAANLLAACEALKLGARQGLDLALLTDVLNASSGRSYATELRLKQNILSGTYDGGFQLGLMAKDIATAAAMAEESDYPAQSLALCHLLWQQAVAARGPSVDNTEIHKFLPE